LRPRLLSVPELVTQGLLLVAALGLTVQAFRLDGTAANRLFPPRPALGADGRSDRLLDHVSCSR